MKTFTERFDEGIASVTKERGKDYGHPADDFARVAGFKKLIADCDDPLLRHVLEMIEVKVSRLVENPYHFDSWLDVAGYARTACMAIDRMQQNAHEGNPMHYEDDDDVVYATRRQDRV